MLTTEVENYPGFPTGISGPDMMQAFQKQAERFGTRTRGVDVVSCDFSERPFKLTTSEGDVVLAETVIIATGATANWLGLENELRLATSGGGVSACAVCDGALPMFRDKPLGVVGGGDSAMEEASYLAKFASKVYVINRRDALRASQTMQDRVLSNDKIEIVWNSVVSDVLGEKMIESVELEDTKTGEHSRLDLTGLFVAIGHTPATSFLEGSGVALDEAGYVLVEGASCQTNVDGVFAAGDVADATYRQAITAAGMGCRAAIDAEHWIANQG